MSGHAEQFVNACLARDLGLGFMATETNVLDQLLEMHRLDRWVGRLPMPATFETGGAGEAARAIPHYVPVEGAEPEAAAALTGAGEGMTGPPEPGERPDRRAAVWLCLLILLGFGLRLTALVWGQAYCHFAQGDGIEAYSVAVDYGLGAPRALYLGQPNFNERSSSPARSGPYSVLSAAGSGVRWKALPWGLCCSIRR